MRPPFQRFACEQGGAGQENEERAKKGVAIHHIHHDMEAKMPTPCCPFSVHRLLLFLSNNRNPMRDAQLGETVGINAHGHYTVSSQFSWTPCPRDVRKNWKNWQLPLGLGIRTGMISSRPAGEGTLKWTLVSHPIVVPHFNHVRGAIESYQIAPYASLLSLHHSWVWEG